jgi:hypothetical protein
VNVRCLTCISKQEGQKTGLDLLTLSAGTVKDSEGLEGSHGGIKYVACDVYEQVARTWCIARYCVFPKRKWPNKVGPVRSET